MIPLHDALRPAVAAALVTSLLAAQSVTTTANATTPQTLYHGPLSLSASVPAGPIPNGYQLSVFPAQDFASLYRRRFGWSLSEHVTSTMDRYSHAGWHQRELIFEAPNGPEAGYVTIDASASSSVISLGQGQVDITVIAFVDNTPVLALNETRRISVRVPVRPEPGSPTVVRLDTLTGIRWWPGGSASTNVSVVFSPEPHVRTTTTGPGCGPVQLGATVAALDTTITLTDPTAATSLAVLALGRTPGNTPLGSYMGAPCTLWLQPFGLHAWPLTGSASASLTFDPLPLPGFVMHLQAGTLDNSGAFRISNALEVDVH